MPPKKLVAAGIDDRGGWIFRVGRKGSRPVQREAVSLIGGSTMALDLPADVLGFMHEIFSACNRRITEKLSNNPNIPEESLDLTWIEYLSGYSTANILPSNWLVKIDTHYLGGLRHWHGWEIADIGLLLFIRRGGQIQQSKVALLQSKRLYPTTGTVEEEGKIDYEIGFARLADPEILSRSIGIEAEFHFDRTCRYGALIPESRQVKEIDDFEKKQKLRVYYQFYNPWRASLVVRVPISNRARPGDMQLGTRIMPAARVHALLAGQPKGYRLTLTDLAKGSGLQYRAGWPLERFVVDLFLGCKEGSRFSSIGEERIQSLFYRRSGPIMATVAITIESP